MITAAVIDPLILLRLHILMDVLNAMECTQVFLIPFTNMIPCQVWTHMPFGVLVFDLIYVLYVYALLDPIKDALLNMCVFFLFGYNKKC